MLIDFYAEQAIPHETGHIIVGKAVGWLAIRGLAINTQRDQHGIVLGDFATASIEPPDGAIPRIPPEQLWQYKLFIAGGLAGNRFAKVAAAEESLESDRLKLARLGPEALEEMADHALIVIESYKHAFSRLQSKVRQRLGNLIEDDFLQAGRHTLIGEQEIDQILSGDSNMTEPSDVTRKITFCSCGHAASEHQRSSVGGSDRCLGDVVIGTQLRNCPCTGFDPHVQVPKEI